MFFVVGNVEGVWRVTSSIDSIEEANSRASDEALIRSADFYVCEAIGVWKPVIPVEPVEFVDLRKAAVTVVAGEISPDGIPAARPDQMVQIGDPAGGLSLAGVLDLGVVTLDPIEQAKEVLREGRREPKAVIADSEPFSPTGTPQAVVQSKEQVIPPDGGGFNLDPKVSNPSSPGSEQPVAPLDSSASQTQTGPRTTGKFEGTNNPQAWTCAGCGKANAGLRDTCSDCGKAKIAPVAGEDYDPFSDDPTPTDMPIPDEFEITTQTNVFGILVNTPPEDWFTVPITKEGGTSGGGQCKALNTALSEAGYGGKLRHLGINAIFAAWEGMECESVPGFPLDTLDALNKGFAHYALSWFEKAGPDDMTRLAEAVLAGETL